MSKIGKTNHPVSCFRVDFPQSDKCRISDGRYQRNVLIQERSNGDLQPFVRDAEENLTPHKRQSEGQIR